MKNIIIKDSIVVSSSGVIATNGTSKLVLLPSMYWKIAEVKSLSRAMSSKIKESIFSEKIPLDERSNFFYKIKRRGGVIDFYAINMERIEKHLKNNSINKKDIKWIYLVEDLIDCTESLVISGQVMISNHEGVLLESVSKHENLEKKEIEASSPFMKGFSGNLIAPYKNVMLSLLTVFVLTSSSIYSISIIKEVMETKKNIREIKTALEDLGVPNNNAQLYAARDEINSVAKMNKKIINRVGVFAEMNLKNEWEYDEFRVSSDQTVYLRKGRELGVIR